MLFDPFDLAGIIGYGVLSAMAMVIATLVGLTFGNRRRYIQALLDRAKTRFLCRRQVHAGQPEVADRVVEAKLGRCARRIAEGADGVVAGAKQRETRAFFMLEMDKFRAPEQRLVAAP